MQSGEELIDGLIKALFVLNSIFITIVGLIGLVGYVTIEKVSPDLLNTVAKHFELSSLTGLTFAMMGLSGVLGIIMLIYETRVWNITAVVIHTVTILLTVKISLTMFNIPKAPILFTTLIVSEAVETFSGVYLTISEQVLKS